MSATSFTEQYGALIVDLDGVVYRGPEPIASAVTALNDWPGEIVYATNNASRTPSAVAQHLRSIGLHVKDEQVLTSSQAGAAIVRQQHGPDAVVLAIGGPGVAAALADAGLTVAQEPSHHVDAVLQGYGPDVTAAQLADAAYAIEAGAVWVATNTDLTLPTDRGIAPGNGSLVGAVAHAVGKEPDHVAGKPAAPLYELCLRQLDIDPKRILAVGDRLDTDIAGAHAVGIDSLLVLTGVDDRGGAHQAAADHKPTFIASDLSVLGGQVPERFKQSGQ